MPTENFNSQTIQTTCCIAGGGPAGMMLGFLLARAGVDVQVLEKHADFLRDFRGDTIHPSTFELMYELGVVEDFLRRPHQELTSIRRRNRRYHRDNRGFFPLAYALQIRRSDAPMGFSEFRRRKSSRVSSISFAHGV
jgi:2-polyprenyl-6-methoxyphenol hydroxylase-like FAD-dependent oxidoreductase